jgi:hypothetical protein
MIEFTYEKLEGYVKVDNAGVSELILVDSYANREQREEVDDNDIMNYAIIEGAIFILAAGQPSVEMFSSIGKPSSGQWCKALFDVDEEVTEWSLFQKDAEHIVAVMDGATVHKYNLRVDVIICFLSFCMSSIFVSIIPNWKKRKKDERWSEYAGLQKVFVLSKSFRRNYFDRLYAFYSHARSTYCLTCYFNQSLHTTLRARLISRGKGCYDNSIIDIIISSNSIL